MPEEFTTEGAETAEWRADGTPTPPVLRGFSLPCNPWPYRVRKQPTGTRIEPRGFLDPLMVAVCVAPTVLGGALLWGVVTIATLQGQSLDRVVVAIMVVAFALGGPMTTIFLFAVIGSHRRVVEYDRMRGVFATTHPKATFARDRCECIELWHSVKQGMGVEGTARVLALRLVDDTGPPVLLYTATYASAIRRAARGLSDASGVPLAEYHASRHDTSV